MLVNRIFLKDLRPKARFLGYQLLEQIGSGGEGVVWSGVDLEQNRIVAIKLIELNELDEQTVEDRVFDKQVEKLVSLRHPHVLPIYRLRTDEKCPLCGVSLHTGRLAA